MKISAMGRFHVIEGTPPSIPGKCVVCGSVHGTFIDFGFDLDFYGVVYFCSKCLIDVSSRLGYIDPDTVASLYKELVSKQTKIEALSTENQELRNVVGSFDRLRELLPSPNPDQLALDFSDKEGVREEPDVSEGTIATLDRVVSKGNRKTSQRKNRPAESDDEPGSSDVYNDDSIDEILRDSI